MLLAGSSVTKGTSSVMLEMRHASTPLTPLPPHPFFDVFPGSGCSVGRSVSLPMDIRDAGIGAARCFRGRRAVEEEKEMLLRGKEIWNLLPVCHVTFSFRDVEIEGKHTASTKGQGGAKGGAKVV